MPIDPARIIHQLQDAVAQHRAGRLAEAEKLYKRVLQSAPDQPDALRLLAGLTLQNGRHSQAETYAKKALLQRPDNAELHRMLAAALLGRGRADSAADSARRALELEPGFAPARLLLGNALHAAGDLAGAEREWRELLATTPNEVAALYNLAQLLLKDGRNGEARLLLDKALAQAPTHAGVLGLLGQAKLAESPAQAGVLLQRAIDLGNRSVENYIALGDACAQQKNMFGARNAYEEALRLSPRNADAAVGLAETYRSLEQNERALEILKRALTANPDNEQIRGIIFDLLDALWRIDEGATFIRNYLAKNTVFGSVLCRYANMVVGMTPAEIFAVHRDWGRRFADPLLAAPAAHDNAPDPDRKLRVGFVSGDLRRHSVASFLFPLLRNLDRTRVELHLYSNNKRGEDAFSAQLRDLAQGWRDIVKMDDEAAAALVRQDGIDILVDLSGHTGGHRLEMFAHRPAPVQMTYLGYIDTTGMAAMDYRITDAIVDPPGQTDACHTEKLLRLAGGYLCYQPLPVEIAPALPPSLRNGYVTFGSFNNTSKLTRRTLQLWCDLMQRVPGSRLLLKDMRFATGEVRRQFLEIFRGNGIAAERIDLRDSTLSDFEHLATYNEIDVALDAFPYNGVTTTCEALWMGVPVVTLTGQRSVSRHGEDILLRLGLTELVAQTPDGYVATAAALACDPARLQELRQDLRQRLLASPLCDGNRIAREMETAFRSAWRNWCDARSERNVPLA